MKNIETKQRPETSPFSGENMDQTSTSVHEAQSSLAEAAGGDVADGNDLSPKLTIDWNSPFLKQMLSPKQIEEFRREIARVEKIIEKAEAMTPPKPRTMTEIRTDMLKLREFAHYVLTFPEKDRFAVFCSLLPQTSDREYWELVREVWLMQETIYPNVTEWLGILNAKRGERHHLMSEDERAVLASAPEEIIIWRGCGHEDGKRGLSWTLNQAQAKFFAEYACGSRRAYFTATGSKNPIVVSAVCRKADALAYFDGREEAEIVVDPKNVRLKSV